jgi:gliding motility-associated lipoprotein GldD
MKKLMLFAPLFLIFSCTEETLVPKPPTHLAVDLPSHSYQKYSDSAHYSFDISKLWSERANLKERDSLIIYLGKEIDGDLHFQYAKIDTANPLSMHINKTFAKIDFHKVRAKQLKDTTFIFRDKKVYGGLYEFIGNSATNFQFYLTDSTGNFVRSELLIRRKPNYDSLQPTLNYIRTDLIHLINTFEWKKEK